MTRKSFRPIVATLLTVAALAVPRPAAAANKEHQQLEADLRMLQEQSQQLQNMLGTLAEAIKAVNTRLDQQAEAERRVNADTKLLIDTLTKDLNVVREKVDDNNVRVGSLSQEIDALRQLVQQAISRQSTSVESPTPGLPGPGAPPPAVAPPTTTGASPTKTYEQAYGDYALGLYDIAIDGFQAFLKDSPRAIQAPQAQFYIGAAYLNDGKYDKAVEAFDTLIRTYASSSLVPDAYYRKGVALRSLKQPDRAREAWDFVAKNFPDTPAATLAKQALGQQ